MPGFPCFQSQHLDNGWRRMQEAWVPAIPLFTEIEWPHLQQRLPVCVERIPKPPSESLQLRRITWTWNTWISAGNAMVLVTSGWFQAQHPHLSLHLRSRTHWTQIPYFLLKLNRHGGWWMVRWVWAFGINGMGWLLQGRAWSAVRTFLVGVCPSRNQPNCALNAVQRLRDVPFLMVSDSIIYLGRPWNGSSRCCNETGFTTNCYWHQTSASSSESHIYQEGLRKGMNPIWGGSTGDSLQHLSRNFWAAI